MNITRDLPENTLVKLSVKKLLFGARWLPLPIPCFMEFFGSCTFKLCDVFIKHKEKQMCDYVTRNYNIPCECPYVLAERAYKMRGFRYVPQVKKFYKYMSWMATVCTF
jgi:hypothetical protein